VSKSPVHKATKLLRLKVYKCAVMQKLQDAEREARVRFSYWFVRQCVMS
jgi:hypothetical protein